MPLEPDDDSPRSRESAVYDEGPSSFNPYDPPSDPESVQPTSSPAPLSDPGRVGDTSGEDGEPGETPPQDAGGEEDPEQEPLPEFDPRYAEEFEGMLYLGRLEESFSLWGHHFVIRTLTTEETAEIGLITKKYEGTVAANSVYQAAVVAASVVMVDNRPLPGTINIDKTNELTEVRFPYVMRKWMPPVKEALYQKCFALELTSRRVLTEMGKASG